MNNELMNADARTGTIAGFLMAMLITFNDGELLTTMILAAAGAITSFLISIGCRYIQRWINRRCRPPGS